MKIFDRDYAVAKGHRAGTHRIRSPAETLRAFSPVMPGLGITRLANLTGLDRIGIPVWAGIRPNARNLSVSQGKGLDHDAAKASAMMESIEHWHAEFLDLPTREATIRELGDVAPILDVARQYGRRPYVTDDSVLEWIEGYDLFAQRRLWVPRDTLTMPREGNKAAFVFEGNGLASGNHLLEAIVHGLCELIERDAVALWFVDEAQNAKDVQVDLATVDDPGCRRVIEWLTVAELVVGVYDTTSDVGVPTYTCIVADRPCTPHSMGHFWGHGCHLEPAVALCRAMTEAVQCRLGEIAGARDDIATEYYGRGRDDDELRAVEAMVEADPAPRSFKARESLATNTFEDDVAALLDRLRGAGLEQAVVVDLTRSELGVPVTQVLVPGLEGFFHEDFMPGARARARMTHAEEEASSP